MLVASMYTQIIHPECGPHEEPHEEKTHILEEEETQPQVMTFNVADPDLACIQKALLAQIWPQTSCLQEKTKRA